MVGSKLSLYLVSTLLLMLILPVCFIVFQLLVLKIPLTWLLIGKWFLFWSVGVRLFVAGARQYNGLLFAFYFIARTELAFLSGPFIRGRSKYTYGSQA
jgi:hypothetical protein